MYRMLSRSIYPLKNRKKNKKDVKLLAVFKLSVAYRYFL